MAQLVQHNARRQAKITLRSFDFPLVLIALQGATAPVKNSLGYHAFVLHTVRQHCVTALSDLAVLF